MGQELATQAESTLAGSQVQAAAQHHPSASAGKGRGKAQARPGAAVPQQDGSGNFFAMFQSSRRLEDVCEMDSKVLGKGSFGTVTRARLKGGSREAVAVKSMDKEGLRRMKVQPQVVHNEVAMMRECVRHDRFVQLFDFIETSSKYYLVLELCDGGNLQDGAQEGDGSLMEPQVQLLMRQMLEAVAFLHQKDICHRDVKPHNYMLRGKCRSPSVRVKLGDFGIAVRVKPGKFLTQQTGTPAFMAPELHLLPRKSRGYDHKVDLWAVGVCMVFLLANEYPFVDNSGRLLRDRIIRGNVPLWDTNGFPSLFQRFQEVTGLARRPPSRAGQDLTRRLLQPRRDKRPTAKEALQHEWFFMNPLAEEPEPKAAAPSIGFSLAAAVGGGARRQAPIIDNTPLLDWQEFDQTLSMLEKEIAWVVDAVSMVPVAMTAMDGVGGRYALDPNSERLRSCVVCYQPGGDMGYICPQCHHIVCMHCLRNLPKAMCPHCRYQAADMAASQLAANIMNISSWQPGDLNVADVDVPVHMPVYVAPSNEELRRQGACHSCKQQAGITSYVCPCCRTSLCYGCTKHIASSPRVRCPACGDRQQFNAGLGDYLAAGDALSSVWIAGAEMGKRFAEGWSAMMNHGSLPPGGPVSRSATAPELMRGNSRPSSMCCMCGTPPAGPWQDHVCPRCERMVCVPCIRDRLSQDLRCPHCHDVEHNAHAMRAALQKHAPPSQTLWGGIASFFVSPTNRCNMSAERARLDARRDLVEDRFLFRGVDPEFGVVGHVG